MKRLQFGLAASLAGIGIGIAVAGPGGEYLPGAAGVADWWQPNETRPFPAATAAPNAHGTLTTLSAGGSIDTRGHAFFTALGSNGRACVTCHQPADGMALSLASIGKRWSAAGAADPLFAAYDGSNCPALPQGPRASHSLLLERGLFRIALPWPPRDVRGKAITPDFDIEVVRDPTGCNRSAEFGLKSPRPQISVYRRPRPATNLKYMLAVGFSFDPKSGLPLLRDSSGKMVSEALMADTRALTLPDQARDAIRTHLQMQGNPNPEQIAQIVAFEQGLSSAQSHDAWGGSLGPGGGPEALAKAPAGMLQSTSNPIFKEYYGIRKLESGSEDQRQFRESVARGAELFSKRQFLVKDVAGINSMGFGNPVRNSCAMCHNMHGAGIDVAPGRIDLGTTNEPFTKPAPDLPLFKLTCKDGAKPHPFLGRVILTQDPGYAMTTGRCEDIGKIMTQQMRGLAARAPYFANGSAATLEELIEIYNRRFNIELTEQEKRDLVNLMKVL
jgi:hypothetical protein